MAEPKPLSSILHAMQQDYPWQTAYQTRLLQQLWPDLVGPAIARNARVMRIDQGVIKLAVSSSVWSQEIQYLKPTVLSKLNERLPEHMQAHDIRSRVLVRALTKPEMPNANNERFYRVRLVKSGQPTEGLDSLIERVRQRHNDAVAFWLTTGYHQCPSCHSPTLNRYLQCSVCGSTFSS
ncbi:MAG: DUF721 domain-containing protein [Firmicutes bacterium]|jgi:hypothetical protein|nr:DUF721 domain-containing protein [Bacillota bacterium]